MISEPIAAIVLFGIPAVLAAISIINSVRVSSQCLALEAAVLPAANPAGDATSLASVSSAVEGEGA